MKTAIARAICKSCPTAANDSKHRFQKACTDKRFPHNENCKTLMRLDAIAEDELVEVIVAGIKDRYERSE